MKLSLQMITNLATINIWLQKFTGKEQGEYEYEGEKSNNCDASGTEKI